MLVRERERNRESSQGSPKFKKNNFETFLVSNSFNFDSTWLRIELLNKLVFRILWHKKRETQGKYPETEKYIF